MYLLEKRLEAVEVLTFLAIGNLLGCSLFGAGADMAKVGDVRRTRRPLQFGKQLVLVHCDSMGSAATISAPVSSP